MNIPLPDANQIYDLIKKGMTLPAQEQLIQLREAAISVREENLRLREELAALKAELKLRKELKFADNKYWLERGDGTPDGPFCARCYDEAGKVVHLHTQSGVSGNYCPVCGWGAHHAAAFSG